MVSFLRNKDDSDGQYVVDFLEGHVLVLHLVPNGVRAFHARFDLILNAHAVERLANGSRKAGKQLITLLLCEGQFTFDGGVFFRMFIPETQVFEFRFDFVQAQAVGQWCIDVERFAGYFVLLVGRL